MAYTLTGVRGNDDDDIPTNFFFLLRNGAISDKLTVCRRHDTRSCNMASEVMDIIVELTDEGLKIEKKTKDN